MMKKALFLMLCVAVFLVGCGYNPKSPKECVEYFAKAIVKMDYAKLDKCLVPPSTDIFRGQAKITKAQEKLYAVYKEKFGTDYMKISTMTPSKVEFVKVVKEEGEKAEVEVKTTLKGEKEEEVKTQYLHLMKHEGKWKILLGGRKGVAPKIEDLEKFKKITDKMLKMVPEMEKLTKELKEGKVKTPADFRKKLAEMHKKALK